METVGFTSIDIPSSEKDMERKSNTANRQKPALFTSLTAADAANPLHITRRYLDNNLATYYYHSSTSQKTFQTERSKQIQSKMDQYAASFNLDFSFGNAPQSYYLNRYPITHEKSLIKLYADHVFTTVLGKHESQQEDAVARKSPPAFLFNTGGARFDIFKGPFTRDDQFTVIPFENGLWAISDPLDYDLILAVLAWLNNLPGEPEIVDLFRQSTQETSSDPAGRISLGEQATDLQLGSTWVNRNEAILRDSIAASALRRHEAQDYTKFLTSLPVGSPANYVGETITSAEHGTVKSLDSDTELSVEDTKSKPNKPTFGYVTKDLCGPHGDDVKHRSLPAYDIPDFVLSTRNMTNEPVDSAHLVFYVSPGYHTRPFNTLYWSASILMYVLHLDMSNGIKKEFIAPLVLTALNELQSGTVYKYADMTVYSSLKANELLGHYASVAWQ